VHRLIQVCLLLRLLGMDSDNRQLLRLSTLAGLCEDLWLQKMPSTYFDSFLVLSRVRAYIVRKVSQALSCRGRTQLIPLVRTVIL
jgi:hypothetical protein